MVYHIFMFHKVFFILIAFLISLVSMPIMIFICKKANLYDYQDERKVHTGNIPRLGGVGIIVSMFVISLFFIFYTENITFSKYLPLLISAVLIFIFGIIDDIFNLRAIFKLLVQLIASFIVVFNGFRINQILGWVLPLPVSYIVTFCWIIGIINAYNLIDGLDGLCGSLSFLAILTYGVLYLITGSEEYTLCFIIAACVLGFLCFNLPPAKIFMGDGGSQSLGFIIAVIPLFTSSNTYEYNKFLIMLVITSIPLLDTIAAIWRRIREHRPIMSPDRAHLHHKLMNLGYSGKRILIIIVLIQIVLCSTTISSLFTTTNNGSILLLEAFTFLSIFFSTIHFANRNVLRKINELQEKNDSTSKEDSQVQEHSEQ